MKATFDENKPNPLIDEILAQSEGRPVAWPEKSELGHITVEQRQFVRRKFRRIIEGIPDVLITVDYVKNGRHLSFSLVTDRNIGWRIHEGGNTSMLNSQHDALGYLINRIFKELIVQLKSVVLVKIELFGRAHYTRIQRTGNSRTINEREYNRAHARMG